MSDKKWTVHDYYLLARLRYIFLKSYLRIFAVRHRLVGPERLEKWAAEAKQINARARWIIDTAQTRLRWVKAKEAREDA